MRWREVAQHDGNDDEAERPSLESVLDHYGVRYSPGRKSQMTNCPLHEDRTPSLSINLDKELWRCHSCGEAGDSFTLIMRKEDTDFAGARALAATLGLPAGDAGGGDGELRGSSYSRRRRVAHGSGTRSGDHRYVPAWRRR